MGHVQPDFFAMQHTDITDACLQPDVPRLSYLDIDMMIALQLQSGLRTVDTFSSDSGKWDESESEEEAPITRNASRAARLEARNAIKTEDAVHEDMDEPVEKDDDGPGIAVVEGEEQRRYPLRIRTQQEHPPLQPAAHKRHAL